MTKWNYQPVPVRFGKVRKSRTVPDQSLSIQEIVKRYVRGIPVDVVQRTPVYIDQNDHDLEKLGRMDFGEKAEMARVMAQESEQIRSEYQRAAKERSDAKASAAKKGSEAPEEKTAQEGAAPAARA